MSFLVMSVQGDGIMKLEKATRILGSEKKARRAYSMSINRVGRKGFTKVKRVVAKQVKLTQKKVVQYGNVKQNFAHSAKLEHRITSRGGEVPLKEFRARETKRGVVANPMGKRQLFEHTFIKSGWWPTRHGPVGNGHVFSPDLSTNKAGRAFKRTRSGVSIPIQIVEDQSKAAFNANAKALPIEINKMIRKMTGGVVS